MATITCYEQTNFQPDKTKKVYKTDQVDLTKDFPNGIHSAIVTINGPVTVYQEVGYQGLSEELAVGQYPNQSKFPPGEAGFKSLKVE